MNDLWSRGSRARRWLLVVEVISALILTALSLLAMVGAYQSWRGLVATVCLFAAFLLRRSSLRWTFVLAMAGGLLQLIEPHDFIMFGDLLYAPICAAFGVDRDARWRRTGLAGAVAAAVAPGVLLVPRLLLAEPSSPSPWAVVGLSAIFMGAAAVVSVGGWTWGYLRLQQRRQIEGAIAVQLSDAERLRLEQISAQSAFREQIAAEMHDVVGHSWAVVAAQADGARYALRTSPDAAEKALETIADLARTSITELREILRQLRYSEGVEGQVSTEQQAALVARMRDAGMTLDFTETGTPPASQTIRLTAHRLLTETLTNVLKHGDLRHPVHVCLAWHDGFTIDATNRVDPKSGGSGGTDGLGITGMRARARSLGGDVHVSTDAQTWTLHALVPGHDVDNTSNSENPSPLRPQSPHPATDPGVSTGLDARRPITSTPEEPS